MERDVFNKILKLAVVLLFCLTILTVYCNIRDKSYEKYENGVNEITYSLVITRDGYETKKEKEELVIEKRPSWTEQLK